MGQSNEKWHKLMRRLLRPCGAVDVVEGSQALPEPAPEQCERCDGSGWEWFEHGVGCGESLDCCRDCGGTGRKREAIPISGMDPAKGESWTATTAVYEDENGVQVLGFGPKFWEGIEEKTDAVEAEKLWTHAAMLALVVSLFVAYWGIAVALRFWLGG